MIIDDDLYLIDRLSVLTVQLPVKVLNLDYCIFGTAQYFWVGNYSVGHDQLRGLREERSRIIAAREGIVPV